VKKRWLRILLGLLVLAVWGGVIAKALHQVHSETNAPEPAAANHEPVSADRVTIKEVIPHLQRDPFLDVGSAPEHPAATHGSHSMTRHRDVPTMARPWPTIVYKGLIREHGDKGSTIAFIDLNGKHLLVKQGTEVQGPTVLSIAADSLIMEWAHELRTFRRQ
jgi:hypothetical protein